MARARANLVPVMVALAACTGSPGRHASSDDSLVADAGRDRAGHDLSGDRLRDHRGSDLKPRRSTRWVATAGGDYYDSSRQIALTPTGNAIVVGTYSLGATFGSYYLPANGPGEGFIAELSAQGTWTSALRVGSPAVDGLPARWEGVGGLDIGPGSDSVMAVSLAGPTELGGTKLAPMAPDGAVFVKRDAAGKVIWTMSPAAGGHGQIVRNPTGGYYLSGSFQGRVELGDEAIAEGESDCYLAKIDNDGNPEWLVSPAGLGPKGIEDLAADDAGAVYITGKFGGQMTLGGHLAGSQGKWDLYAAKVSAAGQVQWLAGGGSQDDDTGLGIAVDPAGNNVTVVGQLRGPAKLGQLSVPGHGMTDVVVIRLTAAGEVLWATTAGGPGAMEGGRGVLQVKGRTLIAGWFESPAVFGTQVLTGGSSGQSFVAELDQDGRFLWVVRATAHGLSGAMRLISAGDHDLLVLGILSAPTDFLGVTAQSKGKHDIYVWSLQFD